MSPPVFSSFPTTFGESTVSDAKISRRSTTKVSHHSASSSDKWDAVTADDHRRSAKRRRKAARDQDADVDPARYLGFDVTARAPPDTSRRKSQESREPSPSRVRSGRSAERVVRSEASAQLASNGSKWHYTDIIGDKEAHRYGATASVICPHYKRDENGHVLGLARQFRITRTSEKSTRGIEIAKSGQPYIPRYAHRRREEEEHLRFGVGALNFDSGAEFVALSGYRRKVRAADHDEDEEVETQHVVDLVRERIRKFEARLKNHPDDTACWIAYSRAHIPDETGENHRAQVEISMAILSRALATVAFAESIPLHLEYLRIAADVWSSSRVEEMWSSLLERAEQNVQQSGMGQAIFDLWLGHLTWSEGRGFGRDGRDVETIMELYEQRLAMIPAYEADQQAREERQLYVFERACTFLLRVGYRERAIAAFQALLEISLSNVDDTSATNDDFFSALSDFGRLWDSGKMRLGEDDPHGRDSVMKDHATGSSSALRSPYTTTATDPFLEWYNAEKDAQQAPAPLRPQATYPDEIDPHQVTLFSDIASLLFSVQRPASLRQLALAFLRILGTRVQRASSSATIYNDPHLVPTNLKGLLRPAVPPPGRIRQATADEKAKPSRQPDRQNLGDSPVKCWLSTRNTLSFNDWFSEFDARYTESNDLSMTRNITDLCRSQLHDPLFDMIAVAIESAMSPKLALKLTKEKLANDPQNVTLWAGYAGLECRRGKLESARGVYATVLANYTEMALAKESPALSMWADWAKMEWATGDPERCTELLVSLADSRLPSRHLENHSEPPKHSGLAMLKARKFYAISQFPVNPSRLILSTLFTYQESCEAAIQLLEQNYTACDRDLRQREETLQFLNEVQHRHHTRHPGPKALIRKNLGHAMYHYPNNTQFLSTFLWHQLQSGLRGPIYDLIHRLTKPEGQLQSILWSVWAEGVATTEIYSPGSGGASRVRATLRRSLSTHLGSICPLLWLQAIEFECLAGQLGAAKKLFYRAMGHVGSCKDLYLVPFHEAMRPSFTNAELIEVVDAMMVRGIRLRSDPTGFTASLDSSDLLFSDEELEDDELDFLRHQQANKPF